MKSICFAKKLVSSFLHKSSHSSRFLNEVSAFASLGNAGLNQRRKMSAEISVSVVDDGSAKRSADGEGVEMNNDAIKKLKGDSEEVAVPETATVLPKKPRIKTSKFALLLSYCGTGYFGLQRNLPHATIEEELLNALFKTESIRKDEFDKPQMIHFQRAARTDKGVSAAKQIISLRLPQDFAERVEKVNELLPDKIRVIAAKKATKYFDSKNYCDGRTYAYMMPSYALCPPDMLTNLEFRLSKEQLDEFNNVLAHYLGTHNYHNFTSQKEASDASAQRYIISMACSEPFIKDGLEFVVVRVKGQSFMLHQIRKMVGFAIAVMRGFTNIEMLKKTFHGEKVDIPKAPGLGLMLEEAHYDRYNKRYGGDGVHEPIAWSEFATEVSQFKETQIYPVMVKTEKEEFSMMKWLETLPLHTYEVRLPGAGHQPRQAKDTSEEVEGNPRNRTPLFAAAYKAGLVDSRLKDAEGAENVEGEADDDAEVGGAAKNDDDDGVSKVNSDDEGNHEPVKSEQAV